MIDFLHSIEDILIPLSFFAAVVLIVYFAIQARMKRNQLLHEERMLAIEKGVDIPMVPVRIKRRNPYVWPLVFIGLGLAWILGNIFEGDYDISWGLIPLLIGAGLLIANSLVHRSSKDRSDDSDADSLNSDTNTKLHSN